MTQKMGLFMKALPSRVKPVTLLQDGAITVPCGDSDIAGHIQTPASPSRAKDSKTSLPASKPRQCEAGPALKTEGATFGEPSFGTQFNGAELASSVTLTADAKLALLDILKPETNSILRLATDQVNSLIWELLRLLENLRSFLGSEPGFMSRTLQTANHGLGLVVYKGLCDWKPLKNNLSEKDYDQITFLIQKVQHLVWEFRLT